MNIKIKEAATSTAIVVPWLPEEVRLKGGGIAFAKYSLLDYGEVRIPRGTKLQKLSFQSTFPGAGRKGTYYPRKTKWKKPSSYITLLKKWKNKKTRLKVSIGSSVTLICYLQDYDLTYAGGFGDVKYTVKFVEYKKVSIRIKPKKKKGAKTSTKRSTKSLKTYTIKSGDNLWNIAKKHLGRGSRWTEIFKLNKKVIEAAAKKHGRKSSNNGHWIYPKTKLKLPKK